MYLSRRLLLGPIGDHRCGVCGKCRTRVGDRQVRVEGCLGRDGWGSCSWHISVL